MIQGLPIEEPWVLETTWLECRNDIGELWDGYLLHAKRNIFKLGVNSSATCFFSFTKCRPPGDSPVPFCPTCIRHWMMENRLFHLNFVGAWKGTRAPVDICKETWYILILPNSISEDFKICESLSHLVFDPASFRSDLLSSRFIRGISDPFFIQGRPLIISHLWISEFTGHFAWNARVGVPLNR